jgi:hypothetical protein
VWIVRVSLCWLCSSCMGCRPKQPCLPRVRSPAGTAVRREKRDGTAEKQDPRPGRLLCPRTWARCSATPYGTRRRRKRGSPDPGRSGVRVAPVLGVVSLGWERPAASPRVQHRSLALSRVRPAGSPGSLDCGLTVLWLPLRSLATAVCYLTSKRVGWG